MTLVIEDGTGIEDAEAYASLDDVTAYWAKRGNDTLAAAWVAAPSDTQSGAILAATAYLDSVYGRFFIGVRKSQTQGLEWPRVSEIQYDTDPKRVLFEVVGGIYRNGVAYKLMDDLGNLLLDIPRPLIWATAELAGRALPGALAEDLDRGGMVTKELVGGTRDGVEVDYADNAPGGVDGKIFGIVDKLLAPILTGQQPGGMASYLVYSAPTRRA